MKLISTLRIALLSVLLSLTAGNAVAADKIAEYYQSYYNELNDVYADSTAETIYVFVHSLEKQSLRSLVLTGQDDIRRHAEWVMRLADALEPAAKSRSRSIVKAQEPLKVNLKYSVDGEWREDSVMLTATLESKKRQLVLHLGVDKIKDADGKRRGGFRLSFTSASDTREFAEMLGKCYHAVPMRPMGATDSNIIIR